MATCIVLTGATSGIGRATALAIADRADHLILHGIEPNGEVADLLDEVHARQPDGGGARLSYVAADYTELPAVTALAAAVREETGHVDALINNAGRSGPRQRTVTDAGNEITFQTNYLAPVLLTDDLTDLVAAAPRGRVINISSATHLSATLALDDLTLAHHQYSGSTAYARAKLALVTWTNWLARRRRVPGVDVVSMHPGVISTPLLHDMFAITGEPPEHAAVNIRHVLGLRNDNGTYYDETTPAPPNPEASDPDTQERLHEATIQLLAPWLRR